MKFKSNRGLIIKEISYAIDEKYETKLRDEKTYCSILINESHKEKCLKLIVEYLEKMKIGLSDYNNLDNENHILFNCLGTIDLVNMNNLRYILIASNKYIDCYLLYPNMDYEIKEIKRPMKFVSNPLIKYLLHSPHNNSLLNESSLKKKVKFGFISRDTNGRALIFMASDPLIN